MAYRSVTAALAPGDGLAAVRFGPLPGVPFSKPG
jgi:hypothetical protein